MSLRKYLRPLLAIVLLSLGYQMFKGLTETQLRAKLVKSVVYVVNEAETGGGTGFLLKNDKGRQYFVTNAHVCEHTQKNGMVKIKTEKETIYRKVIEIGTSSDICIIDAGFGQKALTMANGYNEGDKVYVLGHPFLRKNTFVSGEIVSDSIVTIVKHQSTDEQPCLSYEKETTIPVFIFEVKVCVQEFLATNTTCNIYPGNSGSPLVNTQGEVVGVVFAGDGRTNWGSAMTLEQLKLMINKY